MTQPPTQSKPSNEQNKTRQPATGAYQTDAQKKAAADKESAQKTQPKS